MGRSEAKIKYEKRNINNDEYHHVSAAAAEPFEFDSNLPFLRVLDNVEELSELLKLNQILAAYETKPRYTLVQVHEKHLFETLRIFRKWGKKSENGVWMQKEAPKRHFPGKFRRF